MREVQSGIKFELIFGLFFLVLSLISPPRSFLDKERGRENVVLAQEKRGYTQEEGEMQEKEEEEEETERELLRFCGCTSFCNCELRMGALFFSSAETKKTWIYP